MAVRCRGDIGKYLDIQLRVHDREFIAMEVQLLSGPCPLDRSSAGSGCVDNQCLPVSPNGSDSGGVAARLRAKTA